MIKSLYIKNFALIDELEVSFGSGLNIVTGETGAGKSIIIGALQAVLGERADTEKVRQGTNKAIIEAIFDIGSDNDPVLGRLFDAGEMDYTNEIILRREIRPAGSRAFINDTPVTLSVLREVGDRMVDLHGQHEHQLLLKEDYHREVIDALPSVVSSKKAYQEKFKEVKKRYKIKEELIKQEKASKEVSELQRFQLNELQAADLDEEAFIEYNAEMKRLDHAEFLEQKVRHISSMGSDTETNLTDLLTVLENAVAEVSEIEPEFNSYKEELSTAMVSIQELLSFAERYQSNIEYNPQRLEELRLKMTERKRLEKKYGRPLGELVGFREELEKALHIADNFDLELEKIEKELTEAVISLQKVATKLHNNRLQAGREISGHVTTALTGLGIPDSHFQVNVDWRTDDTGWIDIEGSGVACYDDGPDDIIFFISTNRGEEPRPLAKIASGGEVSRVMLAMKSVIAKEQHLPVMIFDEIDTGISGAIAEKVGKTMKILAKNCQIITITHQAQIAGQADSHFKVAKIPSEGRMVTRIFRLEEDEHIREIAEMISGSDVTDHAVANAREMVMKAKRISDNQL